MAAPLSPPRALVFIGFMGAGKSRAARACGSEGLDTDVLFEREHGPIAAFFERHGEAAFREREEAIVLEALGRGGAVALGGGALGSPRVRAALADHTAVLLDVSLETAWERCSRRDERPLARDRERFAALFAARAPVYEQVADAFLPSADALPAAREALRGLRPGERLLWATTASGDHPVLVGEEAWPATRAGDVLVSDTTVAALYAQRLPARGGEAPTPILFPPGEAHKTLATAQQVWEAMVEAGLTRAGRVLALGGGVVGDLAGFCAATYQRGVPVVHV
ncbi:MAG TPA: shikimate kinase, partial [Solirubrobacteraceae bacterium]|nr:shikimate kinase [Solirubrobacteraceae bacterium]